MQPPTALLIAHDRSIRWASDRQLSCPAHDSVHLKLPISKEYQQIITSLFRYDWQHGIQPRTWDPIIEQRSENLHKVKVISSDTKPRGVRISLTFRWTRTGPCVCRYKTLCDSVEKVSPDNLEDEIASNLEELHVHQASSI